MPPLPYDTREIAGTHSALVGVLAGFAFAGIFLLVEKIREEPEGVARSHYLNAMLILFVAFLTGSLSAFLYSVVVGDPPKRSFLSFVFPSVIFSLQTFALFIGINYVFSAFGTNDVLRLSRRITYFMVVFAIVRIWDDLRITAIVFTLSNKIFPILFLFALVPLIVSFIVLVKFSGLRVWIEKHTFEKFSYAIVIFSLINASLQSVQNTRPESILVFPVWLPIILMGGTSLLGGWSMLLSPHHSAES